MRIRISFYLQECARTFLHLDPLGLEEVPQLVDLLLQLPDELGVGVLVHHGLADDLLRPIGVPS